MSVYFVYRNGYDAPLGHRLITFEDENLFAWFQRNWLSKKDVPKGLLTKEPYIGPKEGQIIWKLEVDSEFLQDRTDRVFGGEVWGFGFIWNSMVRSRQPREPAALVDWLRTIGYPEGKIFANEHALQIPTDDDERDLVIMLFDDDFKNSNPDRVAYFLNESIDLPTDVTHQHEGPFLWDGKKTVLSQKPSGQGTTWCVLVPLDHGGWLSYLEGVFQFDGFRLPQLAFELAKPVTERHEQWPALLRMLRFVSMKYRDRSTTQVLGAWLEMDPFGNNFYFASNESKRGSRRFLDSYEKAEAEFRQFGDELTERVSKSNHKYSSQFSDHYARIAYHLDSPRLENSEHLSMFFFDDVWANNHPDLAAALLHFGSEELCLFDSNDSEAQ